MRRVGFAGLGRMGEPMVTNLVDAGFEVCVWNRTADVAERFAEKTGATAVATPRELAETTDVVISMLADDRASWAVHEGSDGLFAAAGGATHFVVMGTMSPSHVRSLAAAAGDRTVIDAPVSGSIDAARTAQLTIMAGAGESDLDPIVPVLETMGSRVVCLGSIGTGATMKLVVNMLIHGLNQSVAEALVLAEAAGISPNLAYGVIENSAAAAPMIGYRKPQYLDEENSPVSFALRLAGKDVGLAMTLAADLDIELPQTSLNLEQLRAAEVEGYGDRDMAAITSYLREVAARRRPRDDRERAGTEQGDDPHRTSTNGEPT